MRPGQRVAGVEIFKLLGEGFIEVFDSSVGPYMVQGCEAQRYILFDKIDLGGFGNKLRASAVKNIFGALNLLKNSLPMNNLMSFPVW